MPDTIAAARALHTDPEAPSLEALWMPFSYSRHFKAAPRMMVSASGMHYTAADGRQILDGCSGLWCVNAGHCRAPIVEAIARTAATVDFAPSFQMGHPLAFRFAERLAAMAPSGLDRIFFANSGSEAVDSALKIALAYHVANGEPDRVRFIGRLRGYHGVGFGGLSVGRIENNRRAFASQLLPHVDHMRDTHDPARNAFSRGQPAFGVELADDLEQIIAERGAHTIAAVIIEPLAGSTGVLVPPVGYLERLRAICDRHGILLIFDEVITGFGRLGTPFGADFFQVKPDLMTCAKGITNGAVPMGAVFVRRDLHETIVQAAGWGIEFFHGYTYSGHPLAAAAGLATLEVYEQEGLFARAAAHAPIFEQLVHGLRGRPSVIDIRNLGLVAAIELAPGEQPGARGYALLQAAFARGLLVRVTGDIVALAPPLIASVRELEQIVDTLDQILKEMR